MGRAKEPVKVSIPCNVSGFYFKSYKIIIMEDSQAMVQAKKYASELKFDNPRLSSDQMYSQRENAKEDFYAGAVWGLGVEMPADLKHFGTINWFQCNDKQPPKLANGNTSELVLVYDINTKLANTDFFMHDKNNWFAYKNTTHWAYLNEPEPSQD